MSEENLEIVYKAREAFNREDLQELADLSHDDFELVSVFTAVDVGGATYRGPASWAEYFEAMHESWEGWQVEDFRALDAGDDRVAAVYRLVGTGRWSGVPVDQEVGMAFWLRDGKIWRLRSYSDPDEALAAVGLRE